jgi:prephenate dehydrogenase
MTPDKTVEFALIGAGRFGSFWAKHISRFYPVCVYDTDPDKRTITGDNIQWAELPACLAKSFIFLTLPIRQIRNFIRDNRSLLTPGTVIIDCASIKEPVMQWIETELPKEVYYIASHPLFGPDSARGGLKDHIITLIPGRVPYDKYMFIVRLLTEKMHLRVENMPAAEHDRLMAYNLSLIHHLGRTFDRMNISRIPLMMDSLSKLNSIARVVMHDSDELFYDFYNYNRFSQEIEKEFRRQFEKIIEDSPV